MKAATIHDERPVLMPRPTTDGPPPHAARPKKARPATPQQEMDAFAAEMEAYLEQSGGILAF